MDGPHLPSTPPRTAFAGPAFSASPAPSSLPIPKLLSKSVPESVAKRGLEARIRDEESQVPPLHLLGSTPATGDPIREGEDSPLDVFFRAQREERARAQQAAEAASTPSKSPHGRNVLPRAVSSSRFALPHLDRGRSSPSTGCGASDVFNFEMEAGNADEDRVQSSSDEVRYGPPEPVRPNTAPSAANSSVADREDLRRKSQALKDLLFSSGRPPSASSPPPLPGQAPDGPVSPSPPPQWSREASPYTIGPAPQPSGSSSPSPTPSRPSPTNARPGGSRHRRDPSSPRGAFKGPHRPSYLRQEIKPASAPVIVQQPNDMTTTGNSSGQAYRAERAPVAARNVQGPGDGASPHASPGPVQGHDVDPIRTMEADLRRILNIAPSNPPPGGFRSWPSHRQ